MLPRHILIASLLALAAARAEATTSVYGSQVTYTTGRWNGDRKSLFKVHGLLVHEPNYAVNVNDDCSSLQNSADSDGYSFRVAIVPTDPSEADLGLPSGAAQMQVHSVSVRLRGKPHSVFQQGGVTVTCFPEHGGQPGVTRGYWLLYRCPSRSLCERMCASLRYYPSSAGFQPTISELEFTLHGTAHGLQVRVLKPWLPVIGQVKRPFSKHFWFEGDKLLLFAIKANVGTTAYDAFMDESKRFTKPSSDTELPDVYRSHLVDGLPMVLARSSRKWEIVTEMRVGNRRVAQVVFDVSYDTEHLNKTNWFSPHRVKSSYPYWIGRTGFNIFSVIGNVPYNTRRFFINFVYGKCTNDRGFWVVGEFTSPTTDDRPVRPKDECPWLNRFWSGRPPVLLYTRFPGLYTAAAAPADSFLVYLRHLA